MFFFILCFFFYPYELNINLYLTQDEIIVRNMLNKHSFEEVLKNIILYLDNYKSEYNHPCSYIFYENLLDEIRFINLFLEAKDPDSYTKIELELIIQIHQKVSDFYSVYELYNNPSFVIFRKPWLFIYNPPYIYYFRRVLLVKHIKIFLYNLSKIRLKR